jgi:hypothetical protein
MGTVKSGTVILIPINDKKPSPLPFVLKKAKG